MLITRRSVASRFTFEFCSAIFVGFGVLLFALILQPITFAQTSSATLSGTVMDPSGAVVPDVGITVTNADTNVSVVTRTNGVGIYAVEGLKPGRYRVVVTKQGFKQITVTDVTLNIQDTVSRNFTLEVGATSESINVSAEGEVNINATDGTVSTVVDRQFVGNLPLNGRTFQSLIALTPGVVLTKSSGTDLGQFSVNGQRGNANYFTVDGVSANIGITANAVLATSSGSLPALSAAGGTNSLVSVDALQEFRVQSSTYAPEFGRTPGGQVQIATRSGTNDFHATLFDYFRNDALDATDWFANSRGQKKPALRQNDFGFVFGGPVLLPRFGEGGQQPGYNGRNRTFFFVSYEGLRLRQPQFRITDVPSLRVRQDPVVAPALRQILNAFPLPTGPEKPNGFAEAAASFSVPSTLDATSIRIDHTISKKMTLFGRYNYAPSAISPRGGALMQVATTAYRTKTLTLGSTLVVTPTITNEFRFNYSRNRSTNDFVIDNFGGAVVPPDSLIFPSFASRQDSLVVLLILGGSSSLLAVGRNSDNSVKQFNLIDSVSMSLGSHHLKYGVDYRRLSLFTGLNRYTQTALFLNLASFLNGSALFVSIQAGSGRVFPILTNASGYLQDTWRVNPRLTLTYGLRYEVNPPARERTGNDPFAVTDISNVSAVNLSPPGTPLYQTTYNNFAPRVGIAYQLLRAKGRETMVRGGFGVFYDLGSSETLQAFAQFPYRSSKTLPFGTPYPLSASAAAAPDLPNRVNPAFPISLISVSDPNLKLPYSYQWNVAVEQSIGTKQTVTASYVAAVGRRLLRNEQYLNPNPRFTQLTITTNNGSSNYQAMQLQFQRRLSQGLQTLASYTWSHSLDNASSDFVSNTPAQSVDPRLDRGPSDFDVRHSFKAALTYDLPTSKTSGFKKVLFRNWAVDSIVTARSATPINIVVTRNIGFGSLLVRPDLLPGVPIFLNDSSAPGGRRINNTLVAGQPNQVGPFFVPTQLRQGTLGRNSLRGFPLYQTDFALRRQFFLTERVKLQLKAELFNAFNHPNFADPNGNMGSAAANGLVSLSNTFGRSPSTLATSLGAGGANGGLNPLYQIGGPRSIQLSLKLEF